MLRASRLLLIRRLRPTMSANDAPSHPLSVHLVPASISESQARYYLPRSFCRKVLTVFRRISSLAIKPRELASWSIALEDSPTKLSWGEGPLEDILVDSKGPASISCVSTIIEARTCEGEGRPTISRISLALVREIDALALTQLQTMHTARTQTPPVHRPLRTFTLCDHPSHQVWTRISDKSLPLTVHIVPHQGV